MEKKRFFIILPAFLCLSAYSASRFSGYVENVTAIYGDKDRTCTDIASARLEGSWEYKNRGGVEVDAVISAALHPLDPFALMRDSSVIRRIIGSAVNDLLNSSLSSPDTASIIGKGLNELTLLISRPMDNPAETDRFIRHLPYASFYPNHSVILDRALVKLFFKRMDLYIGRQTIGWGSGYAWNPTDVWNRKNPADPTAPRRGVNAIRAEIPMGDLSGLSVVVSPGTGLEQTGTGARFKTNVAGYDMSLSFIRVYTADAALLNMPERLIGGGDISGQIGDIGVFAEAALVNPVYENRKYSDLSHLYAQTDVGCYYTFENGLYVIAEYYFNRPGAADSKDYDLTLLLHTLIGDMAGMGRHYCFAGLTKDFLRYWQFSLNVLGNVSDRSAMLMPSVEYTHTENVAIRLGCSFGIGDKKHSEFGGVNHSAALTVNGFF